MPYIGPYLLKLNIFAFEPIAPIFVILYQALLQLL